MSASLIAVCAAAALAQVFGPRELSEESLQCAQCHKDRNPGLVQQWGESRHYRANVGCFECHGALREDADAYEHYGQIIANLVTPKDCARCHAKETEEFTASRHSKAARILGSQDNVLAEVAEGNHGFRSAAFPQGVAASAVSGCWQCHGTEVRVLEGGKLDPATWPNSGVGRINPDGSEGSCNSCHERHSFSIAQARHPDTCGKCHQGPDHPQKEIYEGSKHGIAFAASIDQMRLSNAKWVVGEDYWAAPACATCHMSATKKQPVTHDVGMRISWNNRPELSIRPEVADARMGLAGGMVPWTVRRQNMMDVCAACHETQWVSNFYTQYDELVELYNTKFGAPGKELYELAAPLKPAQAFASELDWTWYELWHHEGRRARHGASMMGPDYTHWHGTYEVAKRFYSEYIPQLEALVEDNLGSEDSRVAGAAEALKRKLEEVLASDDHKWYIGLMDPAEAEQRAKAAAEFRARYQRK